MSDTLDDQVILNDNTKYSTPYDPSSFLSISSGYSTSSKDTESKSKYSPYEKPYSTKQYGKKPVIKDKFHPTTFESSQNGLKSPAGGLFGRPTGVSGGATFRDPNGGLGGAFPGNAPFGSLGNGLGGGSPIASQFGSQGVGLGGRLPGNSPFRLPGGGLAGLLGSSLFGSQGGGLGGGRPASSPFRTPVGGGGQLGSAQFGSLGGGLGGGLPGGSPFGTLGGSQPGNSPFGLPGGGLGLGGGGGAPGGFPFGSSGGGVPGSGFGFPGGGLGGSLPGTLPFGTGSFRDALPGSVNSGIQGGGLTGNLLGNGAFGSLGGGVPGSVPGGAGLTGSASGNSGGEANMGALSGQQVISDLEQESGVGEVMQPAQIELKPEIVDNGVNEVSYKPADYGYGYSSSFYQQPLPDITEAPAPLATTGASNEAPPPIPANNLTPIGGGPVAAPPPVPVGVSPPVYGYYYIGRKAWYVPLYFCVYFIVYVGCLILKHMYRHKARYPEHLHEAVIEADTRKRSDTIQSLTDTVLTAFDRFSSSMHRKNE